MICHPRLIERLHDVDLAQLEAIVVAGEFRGAAPAGRRLHATSALNGDGAALGAVPDMQPWDTYGIIYTSGTTGPSKGVLVSYLQLYTTALVSYGYVEPDDRSAFNSHPMANAPSSRAVKPSASMSSIWKSSRSLIRWRLVRRRMV